MGRWEQLVTNNEVFQHLQDFYNGVFPIEVRYFLSQWFEEKNWMELDLKDPTLEQHAQDLLKEMLALLTAKNSELVGNDFIIMKMRLEQTCQSFQAMYMDQPIEFIKVMKRCMEKEVELVEQAKSIPEALPVAEEMKTEREITNQIIMEQLQELTEKTQTGEKRYKEVQNKQETFIIQHQEDVKFASQLIQLQKQLEVIQASLQGQTDQYTVGKLKAQLQDRQQKIKGIQTDKKNVELHLSELGQLLLRQRIEMAEMYNDIIQQLQTVQKKVLDEELIGWKRRQQLGGNGEPPPKAELDLLQTWCEHLADIIWNIRQQIRRMSILRAQLPINMPQGVVDILPNLNDIITGMLSSLVTSTFIVEQQPPQVLKKESRFSATIRLLVGGKLNIQMNAPQVKATIISEGLAKNMLRSDMKAKSQTSGLILNNTGTMDFQSATSASASFPSSGSLSITFRNMQLKKIVRSDKKGSEAVTEEKFCILFQSDFNVGGNDLVFQVWTLSLPVVVTVHGNQECNAMATVLWDNAFSEPGRLPFVVPDQVPWPKLGEHLSMKFKQYTGRGLTKDNLDYLASKLFGLQASYDTLMVSWVQFNKDVLKERNFTFWEWFYAVLKLTKEHLKGPWNDGSIIGFISKTQAQDFLNQRDNGTFLLRFSDSECGGITIAWIAESNVPNEREVWNLAPYITRDFTIRGLADRIHDLKNLVTLYPDIPKNLAFSKYYTVPQDQEQPSRHGYVPTHLVTVMVNPMDMDMMAQSPPIHHPPTPLTESEMNDEDLGDIADYLAVDYDGSCDMPPLDPSIFIRTFTSASYNS